MFNNFYLTPDSINFLAKIIVSLVLAVYLTRIVLRERQRNIKPGHGILIIAHFWLSVVINSLSFVLTTYSTPLSSMLQNLRVPLHTFSLLVLLQFAYQFPEPSPGHTREYRGVTLVSALCYLLVGFPPVFPAIESFIWRTTPWLLAAAHMIFDLLIPWMLAVFIRKRIEGAGLPLPWWKALWKLPKKQANEVVHFTIVACIYFSLGPLFSAQMSGTISISTGDIIITNLMMAVLVLMAFLYINSLTSRTTFLIKLTMVNIMLTFSIIGLAGWAILPSIQHTLNQSGHVSDAAMILGQPGAQNGFGNPPSLPPDANPWQGPSGPLFLRHIIHTFMLPMFYLLGLTSLANFVIFPFIARLVLIKPLNILLNGVQRVQDGDLAVHIPIKTNDEIGFLSEAFNLMVSQLHQNVALLEQRVSERTREIEEAHQELKIKQTQLESANHQLSALAVTDELTNIKNRRAFQDSLNLHTALAERMDTPLSMLMIDVDHFKQINDTYGHPLGDQCLQTLARVLEEGVREIDVVARYGGEEFAAILPNTNDSGARVIAEKLRREVNSAPWPVPTLTVSIGAATRLPESTQPIDLVDLADQALYEAKRQGRNRVVHIVDVIT